jgi:hypothetical protein
VNNATSVLGGPVYKVEILPPGYYLTTRTWPNPTFFGTLLLHVLIENPAVGLGVSFLASLPQIFDGLWHLITVHVNPLGYQAGSNTPMTLEVGHLIPGQGSRQLQIMPVFGANGVQGGKPVPVIPNVFNIPFGDMQDGTNGQPPWSLGFDLPVKGGAFPLDFTNLNAYDGLMGPVLFDNRVPIAAAELTGDYLVDQDGFALIHPILPGGATQPYPIHSQGNRPLFITNQGAGVDNPVFILGSAPFIEPNGYVQIESLDISTPGGSPFNQSGPGIP